MILKRSIKERIQGGVWEIPGGKLDEGQDISHAIEREVFEETSLLVTPITRIGYFESEIISGGPYAGMPYIVFIGISKMDNGTVKISPEHNDYLWVKLKDFEKYDLRPEIRKAFIVLQKSLRQAVKKL